MKKCPACFNEVQETDKFCPICGQDLRETNTVTNENDVPPVPGTIPETMEQLKAYAKMQNWPLADMHVHIGENYTGARAFGIYQDGTDFIVYKNKANGQRAIRYQGPDERKAVGELWLKLHDEVMKRKSVTTVQKGNWTETTRRNGRSVVRTRTYNGPITTKHKVGFGALFTIPIIIVALVFGMVMGCSRSGYYSYGGNYYHYTHDNWYLYDSYLDDWYPAYYVPYELEDNYRDYAVDSGDYSDFSSSSSYDSSWDDVDDSWDSSDSWDSFDTDWDSDW